MRLSRSKDKIVFSLDTIYFISKGQQEFKPLNHFIKRHKPATCAYHYWFMSILIIMTQITYKLFTTVED